MADQQEEQARLQRQMTKQAIDLAMQNRWREAIAVNQSILDVIPTDVDTFNRMGKAYMELGDFTKAKEAYNKALALSPENAIARKNIDRIAKLKKAKATVNDERRKVTPDHFIGEVGKAGVVSLINVANASVLAKITAGDQVYLKTALPQLNVENDAGEYLGQIEAPHGFRLAKLMEGGNEYTAAVVSVDDSGMKAIIREVSQHPSQLGRLSFPPKATSDGFHAHIRDSLLRSDSEEDYLEEFEDLEEGMAEEGELLPEGFSIFEEGVPDDGESLEQDLIEEE